MKKILFTAYTLDIGGIENALKDLLNELIKKYDVTLILEKKEGFLLDELDNKIKIVEYKPSQNHNKIFRKAINLLKRIIFIVKYKNRYDFAASFATYSKMGSFCARMASKNNALWIHTNYLELYSGDKSKMQSFFKFIKYNKFKKLVFVSNEAKENFNKVFKSQKSSVVIYNLIDDLKIIDKSNEAIKMKKDNNITFLNVSRHDEDSKKITRIINVADRLKKENVKFKILLIGEGKDTNLYKNIVIEKNLNDNIVFLGEQKNPYPYFKISDCFILTSQYEGYPVVFNEAMILGIPIITTEVSDSKEIVNNQYGIVTKKDEDSIYMAVKEFIEKGYKIKNKFDSKEYNKTILNKLGDLIGE